MTFSRFRPSEELIVTLLAVFKAGLAYVPLAPNWPEGRVRHVIEDAGPVMILTNMGRSVSCVLTELRIAIIAHHRSIRCPI